MISVSAQFYISIFVLFLFSLGFSYNIVARKKEQDGKLNEIDYISIVFFPCQHFERR